MKNRIPDSELLALTPDMWAAWYDQQDATLRADIIRASDALVHQGLTARQAMVSVYALVESAKLDELDRLYNLPHSVN